MNPSTTHHNLKGKLTTMGYRKWGLSALLLVLWQLLSINISPILLPSPVAVISTTLTSLFDGEFMTDLLLTLFRGGFGFLMSMVIGTLIATLFYLKKPVKSLLMPYVSILQSIPRISWILLAMIWLPFNSTIVIFILVVTLLPIVVINVNEGFEEIDHRLLDMARIFKVEKRDILYNIYLPSMATSIISSAKVTLGITWKTVIMAELLTVQSGMGARMGYLRTILATEQIIGITLIIILVNALMQQLLTMLSRHMKRWRIPDAHHHH